MMSKSEAVNIVNDFMVASDANKEALSILLDGAYNMGYISGFKYAATTGCIVVVVAGAAILVSKQFRGFNGLIAQKHSKRGQEN